MRTDVRTWLALAAAIGAVALPAAVGCSAPCEDECLDQYEECVDRSPPGASRSDCAAQYDRCLASCPDSAAPPP